MEAQNNDFTYYCYGNCTSPINVQSYPGFLLVGGSTDVDNALKKFIQNSGGGDILVLRASGSDGYNQYLYELEKCNSVSSIVFHNKQASFSTFVLEKIEKASGIFFAGGDQSLYWKYWKNTPVETKVNQAITNRNIPIGGTSAGMAIQTQYIYSGEFESATSNVVLRNPYDRTVTIEHDFLTNPFFVNTICDQHFYQRDRMGRLLVFLARCMKDNGFATFRGIACDESTSVFQSGNVGTIYAHYPNERNGNSCYFFDAQSPPTICQVDTPLTLHNVTVYRLSNQQLFDFNAWRPLDQLISPYTLNVNAGVISSTQSGGSIY